MSCTGNTKQGYDCNPQTAATELAQVLRPVSSHDAVVTAVTTAARMIRSCHGSLCCVDYGLQLRRHRHRRVTVGGVLRVPNGAQCAAVNMQLA